MSFQFSLFWVDSEEITAAVVWDLSFTMTVFYTHSMSVYIAICALSECSNLLTILHMKKSLLIPKNHHLIVVII